MTEHVIDVNEVDFEYEVIQFSQNVPVVVDFWAPWCQPCKTLGPLLERLAEKSQGGFRLAKVNVDANPNLALRFSVRSIPTVKAFVDGQLAAEFTGLIPEARIRAFLNQLSPAPYLLELEKAAGLLSQRQHHAAEAIFRDVLDQKPDEPAALLGLAKALLAQGEAHEALFVLGGFPASREYAAAQRLLPLAEALLEQPPEPAGDEPPLDAAFRRTLRLAGRGSLYPALDGLLDILRQDRRYRGGKAHQVFLALLDLLGEDDPETRTYRAELTSVLF